MLRPILFNIFINDLLLFIKETDICNFADDTTPYASGKELDTITFKLHIETNTVIQWFYDNEMVANPSKFQLMFLSIKKRCLFSIIISSTAASRQEDSHSTGSQSVVITAVSQPGAQARIL